MKLNVTISYQNLNKRHPVEVPLLMRLLNLCHFDRVGTICYDGRWYRMSNYILIPAMRVNNGHDNVRSYNGFIEERTNQKLHVTAPTIATAPTGPGLVKSVQMF